jgi:hypothetical protein
MSKHRVSPHQLKLWALFILYKLAHQKKAEGYERTWMLRFLLAFLYSHAKGDDRSSFDAYWRAATRPKGKGEPDEAAAKIRGIDMRRHAGGICLALGEEPKNIHDRFWDELTREAYAGRGETVRIMR